MHGIGPGFGLLNLNRWVEPGRSVHPHQLAMETVARWAKGSYANEEAYKDALIKEVEATIMGVLIYISDA